MTDQFLIGNYRNFTYLVSYDGQSLVIDPQPDLKPWQSRMSELNTKLVGVVITHSHWDHVGGLPVIAKEYADEKIPIYIHRADAERLKSAPAEIRDRFVFVDEGDKIPVGWVSLEVLHTPGHSKGECCYYIDTDPPQLFTGDTIFVGMVGRTDLEGGSTAELFDTIQRLKKLPPDTIIYPGHHYGTTPTSTLRREGRENDAFKCATVKELDAIP